MCTIGCLWMGPECKSTFFDSSAGMCYYDPGNTDGEILADDLDLPNNTVYMSIKDTEYSIKYEVRTLFTQFTYSSDLKLRITCFSEHYKNCVYLFQTHLTTFCSSGSARDYVIGQTGSLTPSYPHNVAPLVPAHNLDSVRFVTHDQVEAKKTFHSYP